MSELHNAKITGTQLGYEDHGIFTCMLFLDCKDFSIGFGGFTLDNYEQASDKRVDRIGIGTEFIKQILDTVGVDNWEDLKGKYIVIETEGWSSKISAIRNIIDEHKWFRPEEWNKKFLEELKNDSKPKTVSFTNSKGVEYYLNKKDIKLLDGKMQTIHYFSRDIREETACDMPDGYTVNENRRNGFLTVKLIKEEKSCEEN